MSRIPWYPLLVVAASIPASPPARGGVKEFALTDHLRRDWKEEPVHIPIEFAAGECDGSRIRLIQQWDGRPAAVQLTEVERHADGSVRKARVTFLADLRAPLAAEGFETGFDEEGGVVLVYRIRYDFAGGKKYEVHLRLASGLNHVRVVEEANVDKTSRFVFSAHSGFRIRTHTLGPCIVSPGGAGVQGEPQADALLLQHVLPSDLRFPGLAGPVPRRAGKQGLPGLRQGQRRRLDLAAPQRHPRRPAHRSGPATRRDSAILPLRRDPRPVLPEEKEMARSLLEDLDNLARSWPADGPYGLNFALNYRDKKLWRLYPKVAGTGALSEDDEKYVRAGLALLAYAGMERDFFAWYFPLLPREDTRDAEEPLANWRHYFYMMNTNFDSCRFTGIAEIALSIGDHPDFEKSLEHYKQGLRLHLDNTFSEDGYYHESVSYMCWNLFVLTATMERLKRELGLDSFDEPRYKKGLWAMLNLATPPDPRYDGGRTLPPFGDHDPRIGAFEAFQVDGKGVLAMAADAYAERDPELSGALAWLWQEAKAKGEPPALGHRRLRGWGGILRWDLGAPRESSLAFRCDPFVGRYINIENGFELHALGRPLILTPTSRGYEGGEPFGTRAQNKVSFLGASNYEHFWGQLGELEEFQALGRTAYLRGFVAGDAYQRPGMNWDRSYRDKPHSHRRHLLGAGGEYYVLADEVECEGISDSFLHVLADRVESRDRFFRFRGRYDVDLDVHLLAPGEIQARTSSNRMLTQGEPKEPLGIVTLQVTAPPGEPHFTILVPFLRGTAPARVERLATPFGLRVTRDGGVGHMFLSPARIGWQGDGLRFEGTRGILRVKPQAELTLLDAGMMSDGAVTLESDAGGVTLAARAEGGWDGLTDGPAKTLSLGGTVTRGLHLDDQACPWTPTPAVTTISIPAGSHRLRIR